MYPSPLKGINSAVLSKIETWMTAATHSEFSIKSNFCLKDIPTSPGLCFDEEKVHNNLLSFLLLVLSATCSPGVFTEKRWKNTLHCLSERVPKLLLQFSMQHEWQTVVTFSTITTENQNTALNSTEERQRDSPGMADKQSSFPDLYSFTCSIVPDHNRSHLKFIVIYSYIITWSYLMAHVKIIIPQCAKCQI